MNSIHKYFSGFFHGLGSLLKGMKITLREFHTKKVTECYPENRDTLKMFDRFRGKLILIHDENNEHRCIACGLCQNNCPNGTIHLETKMEEDENGRKKKVLVRYMYDHGSCLYCQLCVKNCPQHAITFEPSYEHAVFTREKLIEQLNHPGSKLAEKK